MAISFVFHVICTAKSSPLFTMRHAIFTVITKSYIGLAKALGNSIRKHNSNIDFYIFIADEPDANLPEFPTDENIYINSRQSLDIDDDLWLQMAFKYNLVEFCTCIKPACFKYLFKKELYEKVIFFDPDIFVYRSLDSIFHSLDEYQVVLTPHVLSMQEKSTSDNPLYTFLKYGIYNLGFLALRKSAKTELFLTWWHERLKDECFFDDKFGLLTDQKWIIFLPGFLSASELLISRDRGLNLAPWNFFERKVEQSDGVFYVVDRLGVEQTKTPLVFVHFSSFSYRDVANGTASLPGYLDLGALFEPYGHGLKQADIEKYIQLKYTYKVFDNDIIISDLNRRIYRAYLEQGKNFIREKNPFVTSENSLYKRFEAKKLLTMEKAGNSGNSSGHPHRNRQEVTGSSKQLKAMNLLSRTLLRFLGPQKYATVITNLGKYFTYEKQLHLLGEEE